MSLKVMNKQCATCIFGNKSPIPPARFEQLKTNWQEQDKAQQCHTSNLADSNVACRGHYEAARRGGLPYPITGVASVALGLEGLAMSDLMQICERLKKIIFTDEKGE